VRESWGRLQRTDEGWQEVPNPSNYGTGEEQFNRIEFEAIHTDGLRIEADLRGGYSGAWVEWRLSSPLPVWSRIRKETSGEGRRRRKPWGFTLQWDW